MDEIFLGYGSYWALLLLRVGYFFGGVLLIRFILKQTPGSYGNQERRLKQVIFYRYTNGIWVIGFALIIIHFQTPLRLQEQFGSLLGLFLDDLANIILCAGFLLLSLFYNYRKEHQRYVFSEGFGSYLLQYGFMYAIFFNLLLFLRVDYSYQPLLEMNLSPFLGDYFEIGLSIIFIAVQGIMLWLRKLRMVKAPMEILAIVDEVAGKFGIKVRNVRIWKLDRVANAFATGIFRKSIFLTETLLYTVSSEDLRMIIGHECAHFKKRHLEKRALVIVIFLSAGTWLLENHPDVDWFIYIVLAIVGFGCYKMISRFQEFSADREASARLDGPEPMIQALRSITRATMIPSQFRGVLRWLLGHPDLETRVRYLTKISKS